MGFSKLVLGKTYAPLQNVMKTEENASYPDLDALSVFWLTTRLLLLLYSHIILSDRGGIVFWGGSPVVR